MKRTYLLAAGLALFALALPATSQDESETAELSRQVTILAAKVVKLEKQVNVQAAELKQARDWIKIQDGRQANLAKNVQLAIKKGYLYPAPANDAKAALLQGLMGLAGTKAKIPGAGETPPTEQVPPPDQKRDD